MDLEQIRKAMREGTFGKGVLTTEPTKQTAPPVIADAPAVEAPPVIEAAKEAPKTAVLLSQVRLYCKNDKSDKVYNIDTAQLPSGEYQVVACWGRRGAKLQEQVKYLGPDRSKASRTAREVEDEKRAKGYMLA